MFAVPGWSLSAEALKRQTASRASPNAIPVVSTGGDPVETAAKSSKKRKRGSGKRKGVDVTADNVAELWEKHVESKTRPVNGEKGVEEHLGASKKKMKRKKSTDQHTEKSAEDGEPGPGNVEAGADTQLKSDSFVKDRKRSKSAMEEAEHGLDAPDGAMPATSTAAPNVQGKNDAEGKKKKKKDKKIRSSGAANEAPKASPAAPAAAPSNLTPLQSSMRQKLISSRFRYLNQTLYTTPSSSSLALFAQNPSFFSEYHEGFRRQVSAWPENPVSGFLGWIRERGGAGHKRAALGSQKAEFRKQKKGKGQQADDERVEPAKEDTEPLPRNARTGLCTIADLGCGDAALATALSSPSTKPAGPPASKALKLKVHSFDLAASSALVTVADIGSLPLPDGSVDVAIFCLALMGTNWIDFVEEAYRILRWKGECWIADVSSRFAGRKEARPVEHSVGNRVRDGARGRKGGKGKTADGGGVPDEEQGVAEEEGVARPGTDVTPFVEVLRRRGFALVGEPELGNKMFVRMRFVKALTPTRGKGVREARAAEGEGQGQGFGRRKFLDKEKEGHEETSVEEEARVLKACVYKTR